MTEKSIDDLTGDALLNELEDEFTKRRQAMSRWYGKWALNEKFYRGEHWVAWNRDLGRLVDFYNMLSRDHDMTEVNRVGEYTTIMASLLSSGKPNVGCLPPTQSESDISAAKTCQFALKHIDRINDTPAINRKLHLWELIYGTVVKFIDWDGENVVEELINAREILPRLTSKGDLDKTIRWRIVERELLKERYGEKAEKMQSEALATRESVTTYGVSEPERYKDPVVFKEWFQEGGKDKKFPNGRYIAWANGVLLVDTESLLPHGEVPLIRYVYKESAPPDFWGIPYVEWLIPLNVRLNKAMTLAHDYLTRAVRVWIAIERNSDIDIDALFNSPKMISGVPFNRGSQPPFAIDMPGLVVDIWKYIDMLESQLMDMAHIHLVTKGIAERNQRTAAGLAILKEQDENPLTLVVEDFKQGEIKAAQMKLQFAKNYPDDTMLQIVGEDNRVHVAPFKRANIIDEVDVVVEPNSGMPSSRAMQQTMLLEMFRVNALQGIPPDKLSRLIREMMNYNSIDVIFKDEERDKARALSEEQALREGLDEQDVLKVYPFENHAVHRSTHQDTILSEDFHDDNIWDPTARQALIAHEEEHKRLEDESMQQAMAQAQGGAPDPAMMAAQELGEAKV